MTADSTEEHPCRREVLSHLAVGAAALMGASLWPGRSVLLGQDAGERPDRDDAIRWENPGLAVPVSIIVDDSTCLVNLNRFAIPQFAAAFGHNRYSQNWRAMPVEIPDAFVRTFADWASEEGVRGKWSVVPYPACVGRLDRELPGWPIRDVARSIEMVQKHIMPHWDIHPEMVTHTRIIDTKTGHPVPTLGSQWQENASWTTGRSAEEIADYIRYALTILKNVDLPCTGVTTPGGFGNQALPQLAEATGQACRDVFGAEIPHYFRHLFDRGPESVAPRVELARHVAPPNRPPWTKVEASRSQSPPPSAGELPASGQTATSSPPQCVVSIIGCTGDWTGGWDCSDRGDVDRFISPDLAGGRLVEVIDRGEPACLVCHWTGIYFNGEEVGLSIFREVVRRLRRRYDHLVWMTLSEISRYWAARELTTVERDEEGLAIYAPWSCPGATLTVANDRRAGASADRPVTWEAWPTNPPAPTTILTLKPDQTDRPTMRPGTFRRVEKATTVCVDLVAGWQRIRGLG